jgi:hypothetical protein
VTASERDGVKMPENKILFRGIVSNVDSSVLDVKLDNGFSFEAVPYDEAHTFFEAVEPSPLFLAKLVLQFKCIESAGRELYSINNTFELGLEKDLMKQIDILEEKLVHRYLIPQLGLMRLFKSGNIFMPIYYFYAIKDRRAELLLSAERTLYVLPEPYRLETTELTNLHKFMRNTNLPFADSALQLAFECFELSYETQDANLSYLALMSALESLLNPGYQELRYTISRNAAVLLGENNDKSKLVYEDVKDLYYKRSRIVHQGELKLISSDDLFKLRHYVRESIKEMYRLGTGKKEILAVLNASGFGERRRFLSAH